MIKPCDIYSINYLVPVISIIKKKYNAPAITNIDVYSYNIDTNKKLNISTNSKR